MTYVLKMKTTADITFPKVFAAGTQPRKKVTRQTVDGLVKKDKYPHNVAVDVAEKAYDHLCAVACAPPNADVVLAYLHHPVGAAWLADKVGLVVPANVPKVKPVAAPKAPPVVKPLVAVTEEPVAPVTVPAVDEQRAAYDARRALQRACEERANMPNDLQRLDTALRRLEKKCAEYGWETFLLPFPEGSAEAKAFLDDAKRIGFGPKLTCLPSLAQVPATPKAGPKGMPAEGKTTDGAAKPKRKKFRTAKAKAASRERQVRVEVGVAASMPASA